VARWDRCIGHHGDEAEAFAREYFAGTDRATLLIGGAGFDPRSLAVCEILAAASAKFDAVLIREQRPDPSPDLLGRAEDNLEKYRALAPAMTVFNIDIFGSDNAVVGGRNAVAAVHNRGLDGYTDIVVDLSALSIGTSYPIVRYVDEFVQKHAKVNLHVFLASDPGLDEGIRPVSGDTVGFVHGFRGRWALDETAAAAKLWLPQLAKGRNTALGRIHSFVSPHDTCPILPFPSARPRLPDDLVEGFLSEIESAWQVDTRNFIHAADDDPLDLYRTILKIDDRRRPVFAEVGGSLLILSPMGTKVLALGALLAALERNLPVAYLEAIGYEMETSAAAFSDPKFVHLWLAGDVYTGESDES
jgi:hypothetical protein